MEKKPIRIIVMILSGIAILVLNVSDFFHLINLPPYDIKISGTVAVLYYGTRALIFSAFNIIVLIKFFNLRNWTRIVLILYHVYYLLLLPVYFIPAQTFNPFAVFGLEPISYLYTCIISPFSIIYLVLPKVKNQFK